jgi:hypothetical protein
MAMLLRMRKASPAEHLLLDQLGIAGDELPDTTGELLVAGHGDERTDRRPHAHESGGPPEIEPAHITCGGQLDVGRVLRVFSMHQVDPEQPPMARAAQARPH